MTDLAQLKFFATPKHACSYLEQREATTLFVDPAAPIDNPLYSALSSMGFRRSGRHIYRPHCESCSACIPIRVPVSRFDARRSQRRVWMRNQDLSVRLTAPELTAENYALYARYINQRHADGDMHPPSPEQFRSFLLCDWSDTRFVEFRDRDRLLAVAVMDQIQDGLSAIYTFFDPEVQSRSLGVHAVLWQIAHAEELRLPFLYLGYWIKQCQKMNYKSSYRPLEMFIGERWIEVP
ncbi:MAG: arginyltransferase [Gammaproteobacteria bacterium]|nr:MAG: arginyltransferase [Gammaproteobacteria bacterium]